MISWGYVLDKAGGCAGTEELSDFWGGLAVRDEIGDGVVVVFEENKYTCKRFSIGGTGFVGHRFWCTRGKLDRPK